MRKYQAVIFDLDGTLLDTLTDLYASVNAILGQYGMPLKSYDHIRSSVGNGIERLIALSIPQGSTARITIPGYQPGHQSKYNEKSHCFPERKYPGRGAGMIL